MRKIIIGVFGCCVLFFTSCIDEIQLDTDGGEARIVIEGAITTKAPPYTVRVRQTGQFARGAAAVQYPVNGASVRLFDNAGNSEVLVESKDGEYQSSATGMQGEVGKNYHIEVTLPDGTVYASRSERINPVPEIDSLSFEETLRETVTPAGNTLETPVVELFVHTDLSSKEPTFLRWRAFGEYEFVESSQLVGFPPGPKSCYVKENIDFDQVFIFSNENTDGNFSLQQKLVEERIDDRFGFKYSFYVEQYSITENAYRFWEAVEREFNRSGDLFEPPPALIQGNMINKNDPTEIVLGYFSASAVSDDRIFVSPSDLIEGSPPCSRRFGAPAACSDCLVLSRSTTERPPYWE